MGKKLRELLSALMDNETSEFEVHQVLKESHNDDLQAWSRLNVARAVLRNETDTVIDGDLSARILDRIAEEDHHSSTHGWLEKPWIKPFASVAVAASVAAVVFFGAQNLLQLPAGEASLPQLAEAPQPEGSPVFSAGQLAGNTFNVGYGKKSKSVDAGASANGNRLALQANLETRFNRYMMLHAEHAALNSSQGMMPFARVVRFETE